MRAGQAFWPVQKTAAAEMTPMKDGARDRQEAVTGEGVKICMI